MSLRIKLLPWRARLLPWRARLLPSRREHPTAYGSPGDSPSKWLRVTLCGLIVVIAFAIFCNVWVLRSARGRMYECSGNVPARNVALVLGTGRLCGDGRFLNPHFTHRIAAAAELYKAGKVKHLLVSGDNHRHGYDEPTDMKEALLKRGVPEPAITLDYAGFRTLDSVVRAKKVFGQEQLIVVSEPFHNARALFLCQHYDIDAVAFNAEPVSTRISRWAHLREYLARVKAVLDLYVLRARPKFLGEKVTILSGAELVPLKGHQT